MSSHGLKRREFIGLLGAAAAWPTSARGQTRGKDPTIGVLWHAGDAEEEKFPLSLFRQGLQDVGYVEGQNIKVHHRFPAEQPERFYALADELVRLNVDILFTGHDWRPSQRSVQLRQFRSCSWQSQTLSAVNS